VRDFLCFILTFYIPEVLTGIMLVFVKI